MLWSFCILLVCQAVGEAIHAVTALPTPGTILGLALLVMALASRRSQHAPVILPAADALLPDLGLMFVPPGVAAVLRMRAIPEAWLPTADAIVVSSALALGIAGRVAQALLRRLPAEVVQCSGPQETRS